MRSPIMRPASAASVAEGQKLERLRVRTATALVLIAAAILAAVQGGTVLAVIVAAIATAMFYEWTRIVRGWGPLWYAGGFLYALIPALALLWIRERDAHGLELLMWVFIVTWSTDIGAYFTGRSLGKRKLAPSISPGKTIEGLYGGIAAATLLGGAWAVAMHLGLALLALAPVCAVAAQAGDLFESGMKRRAGIKDFGLLAPWTWGNPRSARRARSRGCADRACAANGADVTRKIAILGATGSIGKSTLDLVVRSPDRFEVVAATAASNVEALAEIVRRTGAKLAVVADSRRLDDLRQLLAGTGCRAAGGEEALVEAAAGEAELVIAAIVGCAGLRPTMAAIEAGRTVALANKEALVTAGKLMIDAADLHGATLLPVDSEHNAIFQCLAGNRKEDVSRIILTASGGPFRTASAEFIGRRPRPRPLPIPIGRWAQKFRSIPRPS